MKQPDHLRCGDDDRRAIEKVLSSAYADGRLTLDEHNHRLHATWSAKTFGELRPIIGDLVVTEPPQRPVAPGAAGAIRSLVDKATHHQPDTIIAILGDHTRLADSWDLSRPRTIVTVFAVMGWVEIIVPAGVRVRDETVSIMSSVKMIGLRPEENGPEIILRGVSCMTDIKVKGPDAPTGKNLSR